VNAVAKCHRHTGDEEQANKGDHHCTSACRASLSSRTLRFGDNYYFIGL
jgi:hypothetical protein